MLTSSPRQPRWCIFGGAGAPGYPPEGGLQRVLPPGGGPGLLRAGLGARACARVCAGGLRVRVEGSLGHAEQPCGSGEMGGSAPPLPSLPPPAGVPCSPAGLGAGWCRRGTPRERGGLWVQQGGRPRSVSLPPPRCCCLWVGAGRWCLSPTLSPGLLLAPKPQRDAWGGSCAPGRPGAEVSAPGPPPPARGPHGGSLARRGGGSASQLRYDCHRCRVAGAPVGVVTCRSLPPTPPGTL